MGISLSKIDPRKSIFLRSFCCDTCIISAMCSCLFASILEPTFHVQQSNSEAKLTPESPKESQQPLQKSPITLLQEYCQRRKIQCPLYEIQPAQSGRGFYCRVIVEGKIYLGSTKSNKKEAKQSAAEKAVELHISTSTSDDTAKPDTSKPNTVKPSELIVNTFICRYTIFYYSGPQKSASTSYVQLLKVKYFDKKTIPFSFRKSYFVTKKADGGFQCVLSIPRQRDFKSAVLPSKSAAENDAAKCALDFFKLL